MNEWLERWVLLGPKINEILEILSCQRGVKENFAPRSLFSLTPIERDHLGLLESLIFFYPPAKLTSLIRRQIKTVRGRIHGSKKNPALLGHSFIRFPAP
jgi:hypothetical protein